MKVNEYVPNGYSSWCNYYKYGHIRNLLSKIAKFIGSAAILGGLMFSYVVAIQFE